LGKRATLLEVEYVTKQSCMDVGVPLHTTGHPVETVQHIARKSAENRQEIG
jgi:hypothetical protein